MNCKSFQASLETYFDGELEPSKLLEFEQHRDACRSCRSLLAEWRRLSIAARRLPRVTAPAGFEQQLMRRIRAGEHKKLRFQWLRPLPPIVQGVAYAAVLVAVAVSFFLLQSQGPREPLTAERPPAASERVAPVAERTAEGALGTLPDRDGMPLRALPISGRDTEYVEYLLKGTGNKEVIVKVPRTILYPAPSDADQYYIRNISH